jgi:hypothetical protein
MTALLATRNFRLVRAKIDTSAFMGELAANPDAWSLDRRRQQRLASQRHTESISLRSAVIAPDEDINDAQETKLASVASLFPAAIAFINSIANELGAEPQRAMYVRLAPHRQVYRHTDVGEYYLVRDRYHLVLSSAGGSPLTSGRERRVLHEGELWWFDNKLPHEAFNESDAWRIHLIFDLLPRRK